MVINSWPSSFFWPITIMKFAAFLIASLGEGSVSLWAFSIAPKPITSRSTSLFTLDLEQAAPNQLRLKAVTFSDTTLTTDSNFGTTSTESPVLKPPEEIDQEAWLQGFTSCDKEICYELEDSDFPSDLVGTFYQNGHAKFEVGDEIVIHPFDGDGMIVAVTFTGDGKAWFRNRFIETKEFLAEEKANKVLYRGVFGTGKNKGKWWSNIFDAKIKNVANTHVLSLPGDGRMFALWEAGLPHEIDPVTLETLGDGPSTMNDTLTKLQRYSAHYKVDPGTGNICNFAVTTTLKEHNMVVMEHDPHGNLVYQKSYQFPRFGLNHDCAITENFFVFIQTPAKINPLPFFLGQKGIGQCFQFSDDPDATSKLVLIPRGENQANDKPIEIDIPKTFSFHTCNAFEDPIDGSVVVDTVMVDSSVKMASDGKEGCRDRPLWETKGFESVAKVPFQLRRLRVNLYSQTIESSLQILSEHAKTVDFPVLHPNLVGRPYQYTYCLTSPSPTRITGVCKIDVKQGKIIAQWLPKPHCFLNELTFVPMTQQQRSKKVVVNGFDEDNGFLVGLMLNGKERSSSLVIFDAKDISKGPIKISKLKTFVPSRLHGTFIPNFTPSYTSEIAACYPPQRRKATN